MKTLTIALAAVLGLAFVAPIATSAAKAETVVIKHRDHDRGYHEGWRHRHHEGKVVIIKKRRHHEY